MTNPTSVEDSPPSKADRRKYSSTYPVAVGTTILLLIELTVLAVLLSPSQYALTLIICITGYTLGIPPGILATPYTGESSNFRVIGSSAATFLSGYVLSKLDTAVMTKLFTRATADNLHSGRCLLFLAFFVLGVVQTFLFRTYWDTTRSHDTLSAPTPTPAATNSSKSDAK